MKKPIQSPAWVNNLRQLMGERGLNPRSLSLQAGLNATAVRDMLEGRSRFPRYDTVKLLAVALSTTPAFLMGEPGSREQNVPSQGSNTPASPKASNASATAADENIEWLTEILTRLQELTEEIGLSLSPRDFAAMTVTLYRGPQTAPDKRKTGDTDNRIHDLLNYERLRQK